MHLPCYKVHTLPLVPTPHPYPLYRCIHFDQLLLLPLATSLISCTTSVNPPKPPVLLLYPITYHYSHLVNLMDHNPETGEIAKPSELLSNIKAIMSFLQSLENHSLFLSLSLFHSLSLPISLYISLFLSLSLPISLSLSLSNSL